MCRKKMDHQVNGACILGIKSKAIFMQKKGEYQVNGACILGIYSHAIFRQKKGEYQVNRACIQAEPSSRTLSGACGASRVRNLKMFILELFYTNVSRVINLKRFI